MSGKTQARAEWRALTSAVLIGSGIGLGLGAAYLAGGMARAATDHARSARLAEAASTGFTEAVLQREASGMDPAALRLARAHDPMPQPAAVEGDRRTALLAARLDRQAPDGRPVDPSLVLRTAFGGTYALAPLRPGGALESSRELDCLTQAVYFEARGEAPAGQAAVAQVVMNRVRHAGFPKTVCGVVFQGAAHRTGCQFSFACDGSTRRGRDVMAWDRAQRIAARALTGVAIAAVGDATHFHTVNVQPDWGPNFMRVAQVGLHVFYKFRRDTGRTGDFPADGGGTETAVLTSLAAPGAVQLRLASAVLSPAETPAPDPTVEAKPAPKAPEPARVTPASQPRSSEPARPAAATAS